MVLSVEKNNNNTGMPLADPDLVISFSLECQQSLLFLLMTTIHILSHQALNLELIFQSDKSAGLSRAQERAQIRVEAERGPLHNDNH